MAEAERPEPGAEHNARDEAAVADIAYRRTQVAIGLLARASQREMAQTLHVSVGTINSDCQAIREEWAAAAGRAYSQHVSEELARLAALEAGLMREALGSKPDHEAVKLVLQVSRARRQLLGLNAPARSELLIGVIDAESQRARALELLEVVAELEDGAIDV